MAARSTPCVAPFSSPCSYYRLRLLDEASDHEFFAETDFIHEPVSVTFHIYKAIERALQHCGRD